MTQKQVFFNTNNYLVYYYRYRPLKKYHECPPLRNNPFVKENKDFGYISSIFYNNKYSVTNYKLA